jgi:CRISPR-associated protein Cst2
MNLNLYVSCLSKFGFASNYRGEGGGSNTVPLQTVVWEDGLLHSFIGAHAIKSRLRENMIAVGMPVARLREKGTIKDGSNQIRIRLNDPPNPKDHADSFFFGHLLPLEDEKKNKEGTGDDKKNLRKRVGPDYEPKRNGIFLMNKAVSVRPFLHEASFGHSAAIKADFLKEKSSNLFHTEHQATEFQYPFQINLRDCVPGLGWTVKLFQLIAQLNLVAGNHSSSLYSLAPTSVVARLTPELAPNFEQYGYNVEGRFPLLISDILHGDFNPKEFYIGGDLVRRNLISPEDQDKLRGMGVALERVPQRLFYRVLEDGFTKMEVRLPPEFLDLKKE